MTSRRKPVFASLTRISDLSAKEFEIQPIPFSEWATGDYVVGDVVSPWSTASRVELANGRMISVTAGDSIVGALGVRAATLEAVGSWQQIGPDGQMQALTGAGLFGRVTSQSLVIPPPFDLVYRGHTLRGGRKICMQDFVPSVATCEYDVPTILLIGTSMSSGKTTSGKVIIRQLVDAGLRVAGVKLTGAGRYRDTLGMGDAGAEFLIDFVDAGLPSTVVAADVYRQALGNLLSRIKQGRADVVVAEAGASPLEPYNGEALIQTIQRQIRCTVLCASDPYAVYGVKQGFGFQPDFVAGIATSTSAGIEVIRRLCGVEALNLLDPTSHPRLKQILKDRLGF